MRITHVRVSVLESGPGYNNSSCTLEAALEDGEDYATVANELRAMCKSSIKGQNEIERLWETADRLRHEVKGYENTRDSLRSEIEANRKIIRAHDKLADIAAREGIVTELNSEIPF